jgi:N-acetylglucosamine-6-phosphate deacetylase
VITLTGGRLVTPDGVLDHGRLDIEGDTIDHVGQDDRPPTGGLTDRDPRVTGRPAPDQVIDLGGATVLPGFVDIHTHGGGGASFTTGDAGQARTAAAFHRGHGTTTMLASLVTSPPELMLAATEAYAPLVADGTLAGVHFEGPYLSAARCGAQNPAYLRDPDLAELESLLAVDGGIVRMVTVAPERPGALDAIRFLTERGVVAAVGHTDATYEQVLAALEAGATVGTHVFNGMRPPHHRDPGAVLALLGPAGACCEFIADGHHLHDGALLFAASVTGPDRAVLITDAISAAGMPDGPYELGGQAVRVIDGLARLDDGGPTDRPADQLPSIAGSTLTMDAALRRAVGAGIPLVHAARAAATTPARVLGLTDRGALAAGLRADLVLLDDKLAVTRVMRGGEWL